MHYARASKRHTTVIIVWSSIADTSTESQHYSTETKKGTLSSGPARVMPMPAGLSMETESLALFKTMTSSYTDIWLIIILLQKKKSSEV